MFANQKGDGDDAQTQTTDDNKFFDERSEIHEVYWIGCDANRRNGPQIRKNDELTASDTEAGVSGVVDDYRFFKEHKTDLIEEITGDMDMYGLRKYRQDFPEPDPEIWAEAGTEYYFDGTPVEIVGVHKIPEDEAMEKFDVDYDEYDPIFVPILDFGDGEEVYDPQDFYESDDSPQETESGEATETEQETAEADDEQSESKGSYESQMSTSDEPDWPVEPATAQEYLEEQEWDDLNKQEKATLAKLQDPTMSNRDIADLDRVDCSKNTVSKGLKKLLGDDGYEQVKVRGRELRKEQSSDDTDTEVEAETVQAAKADEVNGDGDTIEVSEAEWEAMQNRIDRLEHTLNQIGDTILSKDH